jgi:hypothetical protein
MWTSDLNKKNTEVQEFRSSGVQEFRTSGVQENSELEIIGGYCPHYC